MSKDNISLYKLLFSCPSDVEVYLSVIEKAIKNLYLVQMKK